MTTHTCLHTHSLKMCFESMSTMPIFLVHLSHCFYYSQTSAEIRSSRFTSPTSQSPLGLPPNGTAPDKPTDCSYDTAFTTFTEGSWPVRDTVSNTASETTEGKTTASQETARNI